MPAGDRRFGTAGGGRALGAVAVLVAALAALMAVRAHVLAPAAHLARTATPAAVGRGRSASRPTPPPPPAPRLPPYGDRIWWQSALATRHWPDPAGFRLALDGARRPSVIVFVYHQVCPVDWPLRNGPDFITPQRLASEFAFFDAHHVDTLTPAQFLAFLDGRRSVPAGSVFLAFDNGLEGVYRYAFPIARRYRVHFTAFLIGDRVFPHWRPGDKYLGWDQVLAMYRSGWVGVQSETYDLHTFETVAPHRYGPDVNLRWETYPRGHWETYRGYVRRIREAFLRQRAVFLRHLGYAPTLLVWPFSTYNRVAQLEARAAGYRAAFAVYPGVATAGDGLDRFALPRDPATFMWDDVPEEYMDLRGGQLRMSWPPNPALLTAPLRRGLPHAA